MAKGAFKALKEKSSYETYGGSPLLGVNGVVIAEMTPFHSMANL